MPDLTGKTQDEAKQALEAVKLQLGTVTEEESTDQDAGNVIRQNLTAGSEASPNSVVNIFVAKAPAKEQAQVPDVVNQSLAVAVAQLRAAGLDTIAVSGSQGDTAVVTGVNPGVGSTVDKDTRIVLTTQDASNTGNQNNNNGNNNDNGNNDSGSNFFDQFR